MVTYNSARLVRGAANASHEREKHGLLLLDAPLAVMCKDCGDVQAVGAVPVTPKDWQAVAQCFHCVCEVR